MQTTILVLFACALVINCARIKLSKSKTEQTTISVSSDQRGCGQAEAYILEQGVKLADPEWTWQSTYQYTQKCTYELTDPQGTQVGKFGGNNNYNDYGILLQCKRLPSQVLECSATTFGDKAEMPTCSGLLAFLGLGVETFDKAKVVSEKCEISGFIERHTPLHNYIHPKKFKNHQDELWKEHKTAITSLDLDLQKPKALMDISGFLWAVHRRKDYDTMQEVDEKTIATWFDSALAHKSTAPLPVVKEYGVHLLYTALQGTQPGEREPIVRKTAWEALQAHVGPNSDRMTQDMCEMAMTDFCFAPHGKVIFTKGTPEGEWDYMGAPPARSDECTCLRTGW